MPFSSSLQGRICPGMRPNETPQWDSLGHVTLVAALESEFNVSLDMADALRITVLRRRP